MNTCESLRKIAGFAKRFEEQILLKDFEGPDSLRRDWYLALKFFFKRSFYQGRPDEVSDKFLASALDCLDNLLGRTEEKRHSRVQEFFRDGWMNRQNWRSHQNPIHKSLKESGVNKEADRLMVLSALAFIIERGFLNIVTHSVERIRGGHIADLYAEVDSIYSVGDKITSLFLRDVVHLFSIERHLGSGDFVYAQPVDVWVRRVAEELGLKGLNDQATRKLLVDKCSECKVSPIAFNEGAWYLGSHSLAMAIGSVLQT
ncbi:hypothetical protein E3J62_09590 [candidate division TA06 bacterium]|uniref:Uncharacterized protein n=1 Tax=candidate division TA06 bacterium TaxID=2250710 RepID=A0A523UQW8_UNCT6|nr:MAG: hypothetical protein E3J62_09590 [candidate division TA06 bacterium]